MDEPTRRARIVAGLRELADTLENHENLVPPETVYGGLYMPVGAARDARRGVYGWRKRNEKNSSYMAYSLTFPRGEEIWAPGTVTMAIEVGKQDECTRVVVGTRDVPAVEAHTEDVYEWRCDGDTDPAEDITLASDAALTVLRAKLTGES